MGMFDYVRSEIALPDGFDGEMQSKDFDCAMTTILIRADGRLMIEDSEWEEVPLAERPYPDDPVMQFIGSMRTVNRRWRDLDFHGDFNFYGHEGDINSRYVWHEYIARFTDGALVSIKALPRDSDGSGEADETRSGSAVGDSAGPTAIAKPSPELWKD